MFRSNKWTPIISIDHSRSQSPGHKGFGSYHVKVGDIPIRNHLILSEHLFVADCEPAIWLNGPAGKFSRFGIKK